jgi:hypothetical protein
MELNEIKNLVGKKVIYDNTVKKIGGVHIYIGEKGVNSCRLHLVGIDGYVKISEVKFFEIVSFGVNKNGRKETDRRRDCKRA